MEGQILNFRGGKHTKYNNHMIAIVNGIDSREKALKLLNKKVTWKSSSGKEIKGTVNSAHGNKGVLRLVFEKGMPGQSINTKVIIEG